jgi:hypothetical protein
VEKRIKMWTNLVFSPVVPHMMAVHLGALINTATRDGESLLVVTSLLKPLMKEYQTGRCPLGGSLHLVTPLMMRLWRLLIVTVVGIAATRCQIIAIWRVEVEGVISLSRMMVEY